MKRVKDRILVFLLVLLSVMAVLFVLTLCRNVTFAKSEDAALLGGNTLLGTTLEKNGTLLTMPESGIVSQTASSTQSIYDWSKTQDGNTSTTWEAAWVGYPSRIQFQFEFVEKQLISGFSYTARAQLNEAGSATWFAVQASVDGTNYEKKYDDFSVPFTEGREFIVFEKPIYTQYLQIESDMRVCSEFNLFYIPSTAKDIEAEEIEISQCIVNAKVGDKAGFVPETDLEELKEECDKVNRMPTEIEQDRLSKAEALFALASKIKRSPLEDIDILRSDYNQASDLLSGALVTENNIPFTWKQEDIMAFEKVLKNTELLIKSESLYNVGIVWDAKDDLKEAMEKFQKNMIRPEITSTLTVNKITSDSAISNLMDGSYRKRYEIKQNDMANFNGTRFIEFDFKSPKRFNFFDIYAWLGQNQGLKKLKLEYETSDGSFAPVTAEGITNGIFNLSYTTNLNTVSEKIHKTFCGKIRHKRVIPCVCCFLIT